VVWRQYGPEQHSEESVRQRRGMRLFRIAVRNLRRRPESTVLSVLGIGLSMAVVIVVQGIAATYEGGGQVAVSALLDRAPVWIVPPGGVTYDPDLKVILPRGRLPGISSLSHRWEVHPVVGGTVWLQGQRVAVFGEVGVPSGQARVTEAAAAELELKEGDLIRVGQQSPRASVVKRPGVAIFLDLASAREIVGDAGWLTAFPPGDVQQLEEVLEAATGYPVTTDPGRAATPSQGVVYITRGSGGFFTFAQNFGGILSGRTQRSILGIISKVALGLGLIIAVSSFLAALQERRREFGILASVGLTDECLYFFLMESVTVFFAAYVVGAAIGIVLLFLMAPGEVQVGSAFVGAALVLTYLPAMAVVAALVPAHKLLQQRPVDLLRDEDR
jgi:putative ABC transport system permease protein